MNKLAFRVIFNRHRGLLMAVAETVRACSSGSERSTGHAASGRKHAHPDSPGKRRLLHRASPMLGCLSLVFAPVLAQTVADPHAAAGRRPVVEATANGLPLVRIARPSAAGVSHNQYSQFNIDARGMVLNNAATITQTRQAGLVDGNPNLSAGVARIILNEVTGFAPSQLLGHAEVAGGKAEVVIANPNGISCNGCGFINTSRAMLSTGTPLIGTGGELDSLRVDRGRVHIGANGLDAADLDQLDLIARSVEINGSLWGRQVSVIAGANQVRYAGLNASVIEGQGERPTVAIDLARLGSMYGDKIRLVGTEAGVGVNTEGVIAARTGDLVIDSMGRLRFGGAVSAAGAITVSSAGRLENGGTLYGTQEVVIGSGETVASSGVIASGGDLTVKAGNVDVSGTLAAGVHADGSMATGGRLVVEVAGRLRAGGRNQAAGQIAFDAGSIDLAGANSEAGGALTLTARSGDIVLNHAQTVAGTRLAVQARQGTVFNDASDTANARIEAAHVDIEAQALSNRGGFISQTGNEAGNGIHVTGQLDNTVGTIVGNAQDISIASAALINNGGAIRHAGAGLLSIDTGGFHNAGGTVATDGKADLHAADASNAGTISAARALSVTAASLRNIDGVLISGGDLTVRAGALLVNAGGSLQAGDAASPALVRVIAERIDNRDGQISAASLDLDAGTLQNSHGLILQTNAAGHAVMDVRTELDNRNGDIAAAAHELRLTPGQQFRNDGGSVMHTGGGLLTLGAQTMRNEAGALRTNGQLVVHAASTSNRAGMISAVGTVDIDSSGGIDNSLLDGQGGTISGNQVILTSASGTLDNAGGTVESTSRLAIHAGEVRNDSGLIVNRGTAALTVNAKGMTSNRGGSIVGLGALTLDAGSIDNRAGVISAQGDAAITSGTQTANGGGVMQSWGKLAARALTVFDNTGGKLRALGQASALDASGASLVNSGGLIVNAGQGPTSVTGDTIVNANQAGAQEAGLIGGNGDLLVSAGTLHNLAQASMVAGGDMTLAVTGLASNSGTLTAGRKLLMRQPGASLRNTGGEISAAGIDLATASLDNSAGTIANPKGSGGDVAIAAGQLINHGGRIGSDRDLLVAANRLIGNGSVAGGRDADVRLQGDYTNEAGNLIGANRELRLSTTGMLTNAGRLGAAGSITLSVAGLTNRENAVIASGNAADPSTGLTRLAAAGDVDNAGRIEGNQVDSRSGGFHNRGAVLGDLISIQADNLDNGGQAAVVAAVSSLDLWIGGTLSNRGGGTLFSLGDINMAADNARDGAGLLLHRIGVVNNLSSTVEAGGQLSLAADVVNNVRENIRTEAVTVADATFTLNPLPWWTPRAPSRGTAERNSNTNRLDAYYLDPRAILSDEAMVTPDGYVIHKATVKLDANDSAFQWMVGGVAYPLPDGRSDVQFASQSRITTGSGTRIIYYINRRDNAANPDQVANVDPWADKSNYLVRNTLGTVNYSGDYGNCTTNCVRLETLPDYTDPATQLLANQRITREGGPAPGVFPVEVQRKAHQTVIETRLAADSGPVASIASGGAMQLQIGTLLNNDNGQIAAGGNLLINGQAASDNASQALIRNVATRLERSYIFDNQSGFGSAEYEPSPVREWVSWRNPTITQPIGTAGGAITSNQSVVINAGKLVNQSVSRADGPIGTSPLAIGLGDDTAVYAGSAADRRLKTDISGMPGIVQGLAAAAGTAAGPLPGAIRMVDGAHAGALSQTLPTSGLYRIAAQPERRYLVETDPRFTSYRTFLSSDYLLQRLGIQPERMQKRLGDGFYEQRIVLDQATAMTGKRFLDGHASAEAQYMDLMSNGVAFAGQFQLTPGIALSDQQMAQLTSNIVWLVEQSITLPDGSRTTVLAPQVYLARNAQLTPTGALVAGDALGIQAGDVDNRGGSLQARNALVIRATGDIDNSAGAILGGSVALQAGNNLLVRSLTGTERSATGKQSGSVTSVTAVSRIAATGDLAMSAGGDLTMQGAQVTAAGDLAMKAGRSLTVGGVETGSDYDLPSGSGWPAMIGVPGMFGDIGRQSAYKSSASTTVGSAIAAGGTLSAYSAGAVSIEGSQLSAGADLTIAAQGPVNIVNSTGSNTLHMAARASSYKSSTDLSTETVIGSKLAAGGQVSVHAGVEQGADGTLRFNPGASRPGSDLTLRGSSIVAGQDPALEGKVTLGATGRIDIDAARTAFDYRTESRRTSSNTFSTTRSHDIDTLTAQTATGSTVSGSAVSVTSGGDLAVRGSAIAGSGLVSLSAGGNVAIEAARESSQEYRLHEEKKSGMFASGIGIGVTIGSRSQRAEFQGDGVIESSRRSLVGSSAGDVVLTAGKDVVIRGSDLIAGRAAGDVSNASGHIDIQAHNITIDSGQDASRTSSTTDARSNGVSVALVGTPLDTYRNLRDAQQSPGQSGRVRGTLEELGASSLTTPQVAVSIERSRSHAEQSASDLSNSGSSLSAAGDIRLRAIGNGARDAAGKASDGDITLTGATVNAGGLVWMDAERNLTLQASTDRHAESSRANSSSTRLSLATPTPGDHLRQISGGPNNSGVGAFPYGSERGSGSADSSASVQSPTLVSGRQVILNSRGGDIRLAGSAVSATGDIDVVARQGRIEIVSGEDNSAHREEHSRKRVGDLGRIGGTGTANTIGVQREQATLDSARNQQNTIRSQLLAGGDLTLNAREDIAVQGADLLAGRHMSVIGRNIVLDPGQDSSSARQTSTTRQAGVTLSMSGYAVAAAQALDQAAQALKRKGDKRVAALYGARAALSLNNGVAGYGPTASGEPGNSGSAAIKATVSLGSKSASSQSEVSTTQNQGSTLTAGQDVALIATGNGDTDRQGRALDGDIQARGARITGNNVLISAARDVLLQGIQDSSSQRSSEQGGSSGIGVGFGLGGQQNGFTLELAAAEARNGANGESITNRNTEVSAAGSLLLQSGRDTRLAGAQVRGDRVKARVGGDLDMASTQDSDSYHSASSNSGFAASVCVPPFCYGTAASASAAVGKGNADSTYQSVMQQSGLYAGQGGYDVEVKGNTNLTGAVIASAADADKNRLVTGTLTTSDLQNRAEYSAGSMGVSLSSGGKNTVSATPNVGMPSGASAAGVTRSAVSPGTVEITDDTGQQARTGKDAVATVATLNRDTASANGVIGKIFDQKKVQQQQELSRLVGEVGNLAVGALQASAAGGNALAGAAGAAAGEHVLTQVSSYLEQHPELTPSQRNAIQQWAAAVTGGAVGAVVGGGGGAAQAGAAAGLDGERYNRQLHQDPDPRKDEKKRIRTDLAPAYAAKHPGMTIDQATEILAAQLQRQIDATAGAAGGWDQETANALSAYKNAHLGETVGKDQWGNPVPLFGTAAGYQRDDSTIFSAHPQSVNPPAKLGTGSIVDYAKGVGQGMIGKVTHPIDTLKDAAVGMYDMVTDFRGTAQAAQAQVRNVLAQAGVGNFEPAGEQVGQQIGTAVVTTGAGLAVSRAVGPSTNSTGRAGSAIDDIYRSTRSLTEEFPELQGVNPHYVEGAGIGVNTNCVSCVNATQARLTGRDSNATSSTSAGYSSQNGLLPSAPFGFGGVTNAASVISEMQTAGNGAARPLIILQPGNVQHVINVANRDGQIYFIDSQIDKVIILQPNISVRLGNAP